VFTITTPVAIDILILLLVLLEKQGNPLNSFSFSYYYHHPADLTVLLVKFDLIKLKSFEVN